MATKKSSKGLSIPKNWRENYASFILGAIIVVILGLLVANFITNRNQGSIDTAETTELTTEEARDEAIVESGGDYKIADGDSLSKIAEKYYGDKMLYPVIARANNIANPNHIERDMTIKVPSKEEATKVSEEMTATSYKVVQGDTLFTISEKMYGNGARWGEIAKANKVGKLPNGNPLIFTDSTLNIPR